MVVLELHGSGGRVTADITDEQATKADLGVGKCFLAPIGKLESKTCTNIFARNASWILTAHQKFR